ncbi:hypothetical protein NX722_18675 [Endozoicomonas gorgoniicola]|uniref:Right handed beta helix domain-containing protein n=1 Tax=Endozoicomonas gorgoniicola TaxID=1234144 RepID=A0ABT3MZ03_9GAMM|nr:hypothetical protein [Endozoicomonas gorgoniicola]MCW7554605.1 hypothetical protein [Endozoicomonas gorgoniicola]
MKTNFFAASFATCILAGMIGDIHANPAPYESSGDPAPYDSSGDKEEKKFTEEFEYLNNLGLAKKKKINDLNDYDHEAIRQMLLSSESLEPELVFVEPEMIRGVLNDVINKHKSKPKGVLLLLKGPEYNIDDQILLSNTFGIVGLTSFQDEYYQAPVKLRVHQGDMTDNAYPLFTFDNSSGIFYADYIEIESIYTRSRSINQEHSGLIRINAAKGVYLRYSNLTSTSAHHELLDIDCGIGNGSTDIGIYSNYFDMEGYDMASISVGCEKNTHTFNNILINNTFIVNYKDIPTLNPTSRNSTSPFPTTSTSTTPHTTEHHHDEIHELDVAYVASGNAQLSFKDSVCNNIVYSENGDLYESDAVSSHGLRLIGNAKIIGDNFFTLQFNHHQVMAYSQCPSFVYSIPRECPEGGMHTDIPKPYDQFLPDKTTHTNEWFASCKAAPNTQPRSSSGRSYSSLAMGLSNTFSFLAGIAATMITQFVIYKARSHTTASDGNAQLIDQTSIGGSRADL